MTAFERINPVAKLAAGLLLALLLVVTVDWVSAAVALGLELVAFALLRIPARTVFVTAAAVWIAAPLTGLTIALYGQTSGQVYGGFLLARVSDGSLSLALATVLRVLALGLPAVVLFSTVDPTALADGLSQRLRLPPRFVLGALAGLRLVGLLGDDWRSLALARRARGVADRSRLVALGGQGFSVLVLAIRRGTKLATAMEARGFGAPVTRTWARASAWGWREWLVIAAGAAIGSVGLATSVATGSVNFIVG